MKKYFKFIALILLTVVLGVNNVNAMSEQELKEVLTKPYTINGVIFEATSAQKVEIEKYLEKNDVSEEDCDYINAKLQEAIKIVDEANITKKEDFNKLNKDKVKKLVSDVSNNTAIKVTISNNGAITVYNMDGTVYIEDAGKPDVKATNDNLLATAALTIAIIGIVTIVIRNKKVND